MRMPVANVHERLLPVPADEVGRLLDTLATTRDELWPADCWPAMRFDGDLREGASGGHGPVRYAILTYVPGRLVRFGFLAPEGLHGEHWLEVLPRGDCSTLLRHGLVARPRGRMRWQWPLVYEPLHDALLEDALQRAERAVTGTSAIARWSPWVRLLRRVLR